MNGAATAAPSSRENHNFSNAVAQDAPQRKGIRGASSSAHGQGATHTVVTQGFWKRSTTMKGELPLERQAVQVQINNGEWQAATYQDGQFVDLYGLPLDHRKITGWRPAGGTASGRTAPNRSFSAESPASRAN
jgi:hypothetical protein